MDLVVVIGHPVSEDFLAFLVGNGGERVGSPASVSLDANGDTSLGGDGELDLIKVGKVLSAGSRKSLERREFLVGNNFSNIVDSDVVERNQKSQFVDNHVLEHTFGIALKAFSQRFGGIFVSIVGNIGDHGSFKGVSEFTSLAHVFADILVVSHEHFDSGIFGVLGHLFQFSDGGGAGLFQVDALGAVGDGFFQQSRIVGGTSTNKGETRSGRRGQLFEGAGEFGAMGGFGVRLPFSEILSSRRILSSSHEPRFNDVVQRSGWALLVQHLHGMVPSHTTVGGTTSDQNDFGLSLFGKSERRRADGSGIGRSDHTTGHKGSRSTNKRTGEHGGQDK
mmetsp:Transcript_31309/g.65329  ORF Transcript_31309/g.65329 Transcript_31309/m.65329 type:complete len:335 (+) Transcript_31309:364-1368(+)